MKSDADRLEESIVAGIVNEVDKFFAITWERVKNESCRDDQLCALVNVIASGFPDEKKALPDQLKEFWEVRNSLNVVDGVVIYNDRVIVPCVNRSWRTYTLPIRVSHA